VSERVDYAKVAPKALQAMLGLEQYVRSSSIEAPLLELIKIRSSQLNGCAYCLDMHTQDARAAGEKEQRIYVLSAWREAPFFSERERIALRWTEEVTLLAKQPPSSEARQAALKEFGEKGLVDLTMAIVVINGWNRLAVGLGSQAGEYHRSEAH
jgi:AhpD family alkylhydroperoxidase